MLNAVISLVLTWVFARYSGKQDNLQKMCEGHGVGGRNSHFSSSSDLEINLGDKCLDGVLNNNHYESDILKVCLKILLYDT